MHCQNSSPIPGSSRQSRSKSVVLGPGKLILEPQEGGFATPEIIVGGACFEAEVLEMLTKGQPGHVSEAIEAEGDWILVLARVDTP